MSVAKHRAINVFRRQRWIERKHEQLGHELDAAQQSAAPDLEEAIDDGVGDDLLRLVFTACHPVLSIEARVALTLRLVGGLTTDEIARAFLVSEATIAQRVVRAKRTLAEARIPFEVPRAEERAERLSSVLGVIYLVFNEGYAATAGDDYTRPELCDDGLRLGRTLAALAPDEPDAHGLVALMELTASRSAARTRPSGEPVLLADPDRARWDRLLIAPGLEGLTRAAAVRASGTAARERGRYEIQAAVGACHARAQSTRKTDWQSVADLYAERLRIAPSPIVELNRAVAVAMRERDLLAERANKCARAASSG